MSKPTTKQEARTEIVQAVNRYKLRCHARRNVGKVEMQVRLLNMRQIQQAVFICRQTPGLVSDDVLDLAGWPPRQLPRPAVMRAS